MRKITKNELDEILKRHKRWLLDHVDANYKADLHGVDLRGADLSGVNLSHADLTNADLCRANLRNTILHFANMQNAILDQADLCEADLYSADLHRSSLYKANLSEAYLIKANLYDADLSFSNLLSADLRGADLYMANIHRTNINKAKHLPYIPYACPDSGSFIGWKKAFYEENGRVMKVIVQLEIPDDAKRLSSTGRKCRCNKAKVLSIKNIDGQEDYDFAFSWFNRTFIYKVGKTIIIPNFDENRWNECSTGIHFFINRQEAVRCKL